MRIKMTLVPSSASGQRPEVWIQVLAPQPITWKEVEGHIPADVLDTYQLSSDAPDVRDDADDLGISHEKWYILVGKV